MALEPYTPDPVAGAATDALGVINRFNDQEPVRSLIANFPDEQIIDWVAYLKGYFQGLSDGLETRVEALEDYNKHAPVEFPTNADAAYDLTSQVYHVTSPTGLRQYYYDDTTDAPDGFQWTIAIYNVTLGNTVEIHRGPPPFIGTLIIDVPGPCSYLTMTLFRADGRINLGPFSTDGTPGTINP